MRIDAIGLEEVVAVGYGVQKKATLTGSVGNVKAEEMLSRPYMIALNKIDEAASKENIADFYEKYPDEKSNTFEISAFTGENLDSFTTTLREKAQANGVKYY